MLTRDSADPAWIQFIEFVRMIGYNDSRIQPEALAQPRVLIQGKACLMAHVKPGMELEAER